MRVITGSARGAKLNTLDGLETRPTSDKVKEAMFNIIQFDIEGRNVLDLFGGCGQLSIEAISRGARSAVIVDRSQDAVKIIEGNVRKVHFEDQIQVVRSDYLQYLSTTRRKFDLIFLDPPYASDYIENSLKKISEIDILSEGGIIVCERSLEKVLPASVGDLICSKDYKYGKTVINLYTR